MAALHADVKNMPKVEKYFADELPKVTGNQTVWNAFLKWSGHQIDGKPTAQDAAKASQTAVGKSMGPRIKLAATIPTDPNTANVGEANGIFYPKEPEIVVLRTAIADFYNRNIDSATHKDRAVQLIESERYHADAVRHLLAVVRNPGPFPRRAAVSLLKLFDVEEELQPLVDSCVEHPQDVLKRMALVERLAPLVEKDVGDASTNAAAR